MPQEASNAALRKEETVAPKNVEGEENSFDNLKSTRESQ